MEITRDDLRKMLKQPSKENQVRRLHNYLFCVNDETMLDAIFSFDDWTIETALENLGWQKLKIVYKK
jgi:hypothetical protein